jgi:hypothetical protein
MRRTDTVYGGVGEPDRVDRSWKRLAIILALSVWFDYGKEVIESASIAYEFDVVQGSVTE